MDLLVMFEICARCKDECDNERHVKAQEELDRIVGTHRMPTLEDRRSMPYVEAIYREVLRLHPPLPLGKFYRKGHEILQSGLNKPAGVSHNSIEDDIYQGYHIPKGPLYLL